MITCGYCGCQGCLAEFAYVAQAGGTGPATLRRCPSCGELVIVEGVEARNPLPASSRLRRAETGWDAPGKGKKRRYEDMVKCENCGYEGVKSEFRYLYNTTLDAETAYRECPKCYGWVVVNELAEERAEKSLEKT